MYTFSILKRKKCEQVSNIHLLIACTDEMAFYSAINIIPSTEVIETVKVKASSKIAIDAYKNITDKLFRYPL
jgi:hypothetical protein